jgi:uncharacterized membrane protein YkgB|tara:strand:+ start:610 stop:1047 length:438 start_codon:yes stop_codon:yes gene_type:complete
MNLDGIDKRITKWFSVYGIATLRFSIAVVFIWFGALKIFAFSPASGLVAKTIYWFDSSWFVPFLGYWEVTIGLCFLFRPLIRAGIALLAPQMLGTFLPLVLLPEIVFNGSIFLPTLEGQYIIKNIVIIAAAMAIGATVRKDYEKI